MNKNYSAQSFDSTKNIPNTKIPISLMNKGYQENIDPFKTEINYYALSGIGIGYASIIYTINNYYQNTWWKTDSNYIYNGSFNVVSDNQYAKNIDKIGHAFGSALISHFISAGFEAANFDEERAVWFGALGGLGMQLYVEVKDGFAPIEKSTGKPKWGFSPGDAIADILGAGYFVSRYYYPYMNNFQLRVSYFPSKALRNGDKPDNNFSDDYEGQKLWLAFRMKNLLPKSIAEHWPSFLMLSVGYHVSGIGDYSTEEVKPHYYLTLDLDVETIPLYGKFWSFIKNTLNYQHFPMPGIEFSENKISFGLFIY
ncbi:MAG: DUF2279 domain-containing protein [Ignavibacteriae bacterium]|nr:DUF2279 domain-containing protein [Ignavibacteriota bacterium]